MICSALTRIMPADMVVHGSKVAEPNRVEDFHDDWLQYVDGKDGAINAAFDRSQENSTSGCYDMGRSAEYRDYQSMKDWEWSYKRVLRDRMEGKTS